MVIVLESALRLRNTAIVRRTEVAVRTEAVHADAVAVGLLGEGGRRRWRIEADELGIAGLLRGIVGGATVAAARGGVCGGGGGRVPDGIPISIGKGSRGGGGIVDATATVVWCPGIAAAQAVDAILGCSLGSSGGCRGRGLFAVEDVRDESATAGDRRCRRGGGLGHVLPIDQHLGRRRSRRRHLLEAIIPVAPKWIVVPVGGRRVACLWELPGDARSSSRLIEKAVVIIIVDGGGGGPLVLQVLRLQRTLGRRRQLDGQLLESTAGGLLLLHVLLLQLETQLLQGGICPSRGALAT